ncbi:hypothetical protein CLOP_g17414 [Closterium sp. NIES-67]|nr:hypothetical protein CLOP_g17414 [Closterium sp. NIES-67]
MTFHLAYHQNALRTIGSNSNLARNQVSGHSGDRQPELHELRDQLDYLLAKGFVIPSTSSFAAPILFTPKKDGGLRMCIEYHALNRVMIKSRCPISRAKELIDQLRGTRYFSKIDLRGGYHQIRVFTDDCHKTAFRNRYGCYEYTVMPFALTNAPSTFQLTMNGVFRDLLDKCVNQFYRLLCELLIQKVHDSNLSGHFGVDKTLKALQWFYYWPDIILEMQNYEGACTACQTMKSSRQWSVGLLQPLEPPQRPWQHVTMDFVTGLLAGPSVNNEALVVVDRLTKMAKFVPYRTTITAEETARLFNLSCRSPAWYPYGDHQRQGPETHLALLARHVEPIWHPPTVLICLSSANRRSNRTHESDHGTVDSHELPGHQQMGRFPTHARVLLQQCTLRHDQSFALFPELRDGSNSTHFHQRRKPSPPLIACVIVYLDDILVYSTSREQHLKDLEAVFTLCNQHRLITEGSKCKFLKEDLDFLGHVISTAGSQPKKIGLKSTRRKSPRFAIASCLLMSRIPSYRLLQELLIEEVHDANCSGHFGVDTILKMLQRHYYLPNASHDVQQYVASCPTCQLMKSSRQKSARLLQPLEPPTTPGYMLNDD